MGRKLVLACVVAMIGVILVGGVAVAATYKGTSGPDNISGSKKKDTIRGKAGDDRLFGRNGNDDIYAGLGNDRVRGNNGNDYIMVNDGKRDSVVCGSGKDFVYIDNSDVVYYGCETVRLDRSK